MYVCVCLRVSPLSLRRSFPSASQANKTARINCFNTQIIYRLGFRSRRLGGRVGSGLRPIGRVIKLRQTILLPSPSRWVVVVRDPVGSQISLCVLLLLLPPSGTIAAYWCCHRYAMQSDCAGSLSSDETRRHRLSLGGIGKGPQRELGWRRDWARGKTLCNTRADGERARLGSDGNLADSYTRPRHLGKLSASELGLVCVIKLLLFMSRKAPPPPPETF